MIAVAKEVIARQNAFTASNTALGIERAARKPVDNDSYRITAEVNRLDTKDSYLEGRIEAVGTNLSAINADLLGRHNWLENFVGEQLTSVNGQISNINTQQIPVLGNDIGNETARAQQVEGDLQAQITSLLNTDVTAVNSLTELVALRSWKRRSQP